MKIGILKPATIDASAHKILREWTEVANADPTHKDLQDVDVLWTGLDRYIGLEVLGLAPRLKFIATPTTGETHIDTSVCKARGIEVVSLRHCTDLLGDVRATAEHTLALIFTLIRHIPEAMAAAERGKGRSASLIGTEVYGKTAGLVGYGRLGKIVGSYLRALGATVIAYDPAGVSGDAMQASLDELLQVSDIISVHAAFHGSNRGLLGRREFLLMKPGAILINTARGELIDELALLDALKSGRLAGAALDVRDSEYAIESTEDPLVRFAMEHRNLVLTPHIGGLTRESRQKTDVLLARILLVKLGADPCRF